eukprot:6195705-Pleurochrysis_carterae.AAC.1
MILKSVLLVDSQFYLVLPRKGRARSDTVVKSESFRPRTPKLAWRLCGLGGNHFIMYDTTNCGRGAATATGGGAGRTYKVAPGGGAVTLCRPCALRGPRT